MTYLSLDVPLTEPDQEKEGSGIGGGARPADIPHSRSAKHVHDAASAILLSGSVSGTQTDGAAA